MLVICYNSLSSKSKSHYSGNPNKNEIQYVIDHEDSNESNVDKDHFKSMKEIETIFIKNNDDSNDFDQFDASMFF